MMKVLCIIAMCVAGVIVALVGLIVILYVCALILAAVMQFMPEPSQRDQKRKVTDEN
jgi:ABC-type uncharacterized transport system permease subunit